MKIRKVAAVILLNPAGEFLIMKRSSDKLIHPNLWGLPAGGVESEEDLIKTATREVWEETGIKVSDLKQGLTISVKVPSAVQEVYYFLGKTDKIYVKLNSENSEFKWVKPVDSLNYKFGVSKDHVKKVLKYFHLL